MSGNKEIKIEKSKPQKCMDEIAVVLNKYNCIMLPQVTIEGQMIATNIIVKQKQSIIENPSNIKK